MDLWLPLLNPLTLGSSRRGRSCGTYRQPMDGDAQSRRSRSSRKKMVPLSEKGWQYMTALLRYPHIEPQRSKEDDEKAAVAARAFAAVAQMTGELWTPSDAMKVRGGGKLMSCCCATLGCRGARNSQAISRRVTAYQCISTTCPADKNKCRHHYIQQAFRG